MDLDLGPGSVRLPVRNTVRGLAFILGLAGVSCATAPVQPVDLPTTDVGVLHGLSCHDYELEAESGSLATLIESMPTYGDISDTAVNLASAEAYVNMLKENSDGSTWSLVSIQIAMNNVLSIFEKLETSKRLRIQGERVVLLSANSRCKLSVALAALGGQVDEQIYAAMWALMDPVERNYAPTLRRERSGVRTGPCIPTVESSVKGLFSGWSRYARVSLSNGQTWRQTESHVDYVVGYGLDRTAFVFSLEDECVMWVDGSDRPVEVELESSGMVTRSAESTVPRGPCLPSIVSTIEGLFAGWNSYRDIKLSNGQVWQQTLRESSYESEYSPDTFIFSVGNECVMWIDGVGDLMTVRRIR